MPDDVAPPSPRSPPTRWRRGLADLWTRTAGPLSPNARNLFRKAIQDMTESWLWELNNQIHNRVPDPVDYVEMRRKTFGSDLTMSLSRLSQGDAIPEDVFHTRHAARAGELGRRLRLPRPTTSSPTRRRSSSRASSTTACSSSRSFLDLDKAAAVAGRQRPDDRAHAAVRAPRRQGAARPRPALRPGREGAEKLSKYVEKLQQWMAGVLRWHAAVDRYKEFELRNAAKPERLSGNLTGLGTSAARVASLFSASRSGGGCRESGRVLLPEGKR